MSWSRERARARLQAAAEVLVEGVGLGLSVNLLATAVDGGWVEGHRPLIAGGTWLLTVITIVLRDRHAARTTVAREAPGHRATRSGQVERDDRSITELPPRNPYFAGRTGVLDELRRLDAPGQQPRVIALLGPFGRGKSQIAGEYAHRNGDRYQLRWRVAASEPRQVVAGLVRLAYRLGLDTQVGAHEVIADLRDELGRRSGWMLIFDDAEVPADLAGYLPACGDGLVLITSNAPGWGDVADVLQVDDLESDEAADFLLVRTGDPDPAAAERLALELGHLPLALAQAADYIEKTPGVSLRGYLDRLERGHRRLLADGPPNGYPASVAAVVELNLERLHEDDPEAVELLYLCAFLAPDPEVVPVELLRAGAGQLPRRLGAAVADPERLDQMLRALYGRSLAGRDWDGIRVHRLVQRVLLDTLSQRQARSWADRAVAVVFAAVPATSTDPRHGPERAYVLPHALAVGRHAGPEAARELLAAVGAHLGENGGTIRELGDAMSYLTKALGLARDLHGAKHPSVARILSNLGALHGRLAQLSLSRQDRLEALAAARTRLEEAVRIFVAVNGPLHPSAADALTNLGIVLRHQAELSSARELLERAVRILDAAYGPDCLEAVGARSNLGGVLSDLGRHGAAEKELRRALATERDRYGTDNLRVALTLLELGKVLQQQDRLAEAREELERALHILEAAYGPDHPFSASVSVDLGEVLIQLGSYRAGLRHMGHGALALTKGPKGRRAPHRTARRSS
jgi:tetratricopeptide (TPR) repeat protein